MKIVRFNVRGLFCYVISIVLITASLAFGQSLSQYFFIDSSASSFQYDSWWGEGGGPSHPLWGSFRMVVSDDPYFSYYGSPNLTFDNVKVGYPLLPQGPFTFPDSYARYDGPELFGDNNMCNWRAPGESGSCWSIGNFSSFTGTFDGSILTLTGSSPVDWYSSYIYSIRAEATPYDLSQVPEPATVSLLALGVILAGLMWYRRKLNS
jgi:hypothetical protein